MRGGALAFAKATALDGVVLGVLMRQVNLKQSLYTCAYPRKTSECRTSVPTLHQNNESQTNVRGCRTPLRHPVRWDLDRNELYRRVAVEVEVFATSARNTVVRWSGSSRLTASPRNNQQVGIVQPAAPSAFTGPAAG